MTDFTRGTAIQRYADVNSLMLKTYSQTCLDFTYKKMIDDMKKTEWSSAAGEGGKVFGAMKSLFYLTCFITLIANECRDRICDYKTLLILSQIKMASQCINKALGHGLLQQYTTCILFLIVTNCFSNSD